MSVARVVISGRCGQLALKTGDLLCGDGDNGYLRKYSKYWKKKGFLPVAQVLDDIPARGRGLARHVDVKILECAVQINR